MCGIVYASGDPWGGQLWGGRCLLPAWGILRCPSLMMMDLMVLSVNEEAHSL